MSTAAPAQEPEDPDSPPVTADADADVRQIFDSANEASSEEPQDADPTDDSEPGDPSGAADDPIVEPESEDSDGPGSPSVEPASTEPPAAMSEEDKAYLDYGRRAFARDEAARLAQEQAQQKPAEKESPAEPKEDFLEYDPALDQLHRESDPKEIAKLHEFDKRARPIIASTAREVRELKKDLAEFREHVTSQSTQQQQQTQQDRDRAAYGKFVAEHREFLFVGGDQSKGFSEAGKVFQARVDDPENYADGRLLLSVDSMLANARGRALTNHPPTAPPVAEAPRKPGPGAVREAPVAKVGDAQDVQAELEAGLAKLKDSESIVPLMERLFNKPD